MSLSFGITPWLLALCVLVAAGFTFWMYRRTVPEVSGGLRALLMGLRFAALFIVLLLLFEPILRRVERDDRAPVLAVLVDDSQSLRLAAGSDTTEAGLDATLREALRRLPTPTADSDLRLFAFSSDARSLPGGFDSLGFDGVRTNIAQALDYVRETLRDDNLGGVVLISDGQYNTGRNPLYVAERYPVPIYTVVVGDTTRRRDVQIRRVTTNEIGYVDTALPVQVGLLAEDYEGERVTVTLLEGGQVLSSQTVTLPSGTAEVPVDLSFTPTTEGLKRLTVSASRLPGETTYRNNADAVTVRVLRSKRRILLLGAAPSPDVSAVRQLLEADANAEVTSFVQKGRGAFYEGTLPADLTAFDVLILVGFPGPQADPGAIARVAAAAEDVPLLFILDRQTDLQMLRRSFAAALPATPDAVRNAESEAVFVPTPIGEQHPVLEVPGAPATWWRRLPPLVYNQSRWVTSPDARVLATTEVRGVALNDPLLVVRSRGGARAAALLGSGTWRWKNVPEDLAAVDQMWPTLLSNLVQWLGTRTDDRLVRVSPVRELFGGGEAVQFTGQVYDESLNPVSDASVQVEVTAPDSTRYPYTMDAIGNGRYVLEVGRLPEGTYRYTATARRDDAALGTDAGAFAVGTLTLEYKETQANAALMRQIAQRSGGSYLPPDRLSALPARLASSDTFTPLVVEQTRETELWHLYGFLVAVLVLLTLEWFFRKRAGMV